ncbi:MAG: hypothetical protein H7836_15410 [Magnetococcus sp. YQC-3]
MALLKAIEIWFIGSIMAIVLLTFLSATVPIAQETIANAPASTFAMGAASQLMLGLLGFVFVAGLVYAGVREFMRPEEPPPMSYGYGG